jgi:hypothetical protein
LAFEPKKMPTGEPPRLLRSLQLRVLRLGLLQEGDVGVGVFPEREESFVRGDRPHAGGVGMRPTRLLQTRLVGEQLVGFSKPKPDCCDSVPIAPESLAAKGLHLVSSRALPR